MDLAGFTQWSSTRTPVETFELLEAVYGGTFCAVGKEDFVDLEDFCC